MKFASLPMLDVPLNQPNPCASSNLEADTGIRGTTWASVVATKRARCSSGSRSRLDQDLRAVRREGLVQQAKRRSEEVALADTAETPPTVPMVATAPGESARSVETRPGVAFAAAPVCRPPHAST